MTSNRLYARLDTLHSDGWTDGNDYARDEPSLSIEEQQTTVLTAYRDVVEIVAEWLLEKEAPTCSKEWREEMNDSQVHP